MAAGVRNRSVGTRFRILQKDAVWGGGAHRVHFLPAPWSRAGRSCVCRLGSTGITYESLIPPSSSECSLLTSPGENCIGKSHNIQ